MLSKIPVPMPGAFTVSVKLELVTLTPSLTLTVMMAVPVSPSAGWTVSVCTPLLNRMTLLFGTRLVLDELPVRIRLPTDVSASLTVMLNGPTARPMSVVLLGIAAMVGDAFPDMTVSTKVSLAESTPSLTVMVIVAVPAWLVFGVTVTVRLVPLPPKTILFVVTRFVFDEDAVRTRFEMTVSGSLMTNGSGPVFALVRMV